MKKFNLDELMLKKSELAKIKGGTTKTTVEIVGVIDQDPCTKNEQEWFDQIDDTRAPDFTKDVDCDKIPNL